MRAFALLAFAAVGAGEAQASIRLDQLSACADLAATMRELERPSIGCRAPGTVVDVALAKRLARATGLSTCFLVRPPTASLSRFICVTFRTSAGGHMDCMAPADAADVEEYQRNYRSVHAARATAYIKAANRCAVGNGDASRAQWSLMSPFLNYVAQFELGFVLPLGQGLVGSSAALHGFAGLDPQITGSEGDMIEFFSIYLPPRKG